MGSGTFRAMPTSEPRTTVWRYIEFFGLCGLAFAQPAFDYLAGSTRWIIAIQADWIDVAAFTVVALLLPPAILLAVELGLGLLAPVRFTERLHAALVGALVGILVNEWLKPVDIPVRLRLPLALLAAGLAAIGRVRWAPLRTWLHFVAVAPLLYALLFLLAPGTGALATAGRGQADAAMAPDAPRRVVMVVFDELPLSSLLDGNGAIDPVLFPNFAALARTTTWYRNSATNADHTLRAFPVLTSGRMPAETDVKAPTARNHPNSVFTILGSDYEMNVHEAHEALCPSSVCTARNPFPTSSGLRALVAIGSRAAGAKATPISDDPASIADIVAPASMPRADEFIRSITPSNGSRLDYGHIMLPHQPWDYVGPRGLVTPRGEKFYGKWPDAAIATTAKQQHLLTLQSADTTLGRIVARLKRIGEYERSILLVTADHGASFVPGEPNRTATRRNFPDIVWTPLFIKNAGQTEGSVTDRPVDSIDVLPTLRALLELPADPDLPGRSLTLPPDGPRPRVKVATTDDGGPGTTLTFDRDAGFRAVIGSRGWPGDPADPDRLLGVGPYAGIVGRPVSSFPTTDAPAGRIPPRLVRRVDPTAAEQPWLGLRGRPFGPGVRHVAVAVNGRIAGLGLVPESPRGRRVGVDITLDPTAFAAGTNEVRTFSITGPPTAPTLTPIRLAPV